MPRPSAAQTAGMDKHELGAFLRHRRERLRPEDAGLPPGARRRTPGLRREEVAVLAHISTEYYVRLEQGRAPRPSGEVLAGVARALRLTDAESTHLHVLAGATRTGSSVLQREVRPSILALMERLPGTAAMVISAAFDVLAWNALAAALMEDFGAVDPTERNVARRAFLTPELYRVSDASEFRAHVATQLRSVLARYPDDPRVTGLVEELRAASPEFVRLWELRDVQPARMLRKSFEHPAVGSVTVDCDSLVLIEHEQTLVLYTAPQGSPDADALALLGMLGPATHRQGAPHDT